MYYFEICLFDDKTKVLSFLLQPVGCYNVNLLCCLKNQNGQKQAYSNSGSSCTGNLQMEVVVYFIRMSDQCDRLAQTQKVQVNFGQHSFM